MAVIYVINSIIVQRLDFKSLADKIKISVNVKFYNPNIMIFMAAKLNIILRMLYSLLNVCPFLFVSMTCY